MCLRYCCAFSVLCKSTQVTNRIGTEQSCHGEEINVQVRIARRLMFGNLSCPILGRLPLQVGVERWTLQTVRVLG